MAISYVGGQTSQITTTAPTNQTITFSLTGGLASTPSAGDLVVLSVSEAETSNLSMTGAVVTSGYTLLADLYANDIRDTNLGAFYKLLSGADTSVVVRGKQSISRGATVHIQVWRGVDQTIPIDATTTTATGINSGNVNPPAITPVTSGNVIAIFGGSGLSSTDTAFVFSSASTAYMSDFRQVNYGNGNDRILSGSGYVTGRAANVSYDPTAWSTTSNSDTSWCVATLALRPEPPPSINGSATLSGVGGLTILGTRSRSTSVSISGVGSTGFSATRNRQVSLTLSGVGSFSASSVKAKVAVTLLLGVASLDALGARSSSVSTSFLGVGSLDALGGLLRASTASLVGSSTLLGAGFKTKAASLSLVGSGSLSTLIIKRKNAIFTGFNSEATRTTNLEDIRVTEDGNTRVTFPLVYNEAESTLVASGEKTKFNALAYIKQNGVWKRMVPNAKHSGIWQEAQRIYKKISDNWKRIY